MKASRRIISALSMLITAFLISSSDASDLVIIGDSRLRPVAEVATEIRQKLPFETSFYVPRDVAGRLQQIIKEERPRMVLVLGTEGLDEALTLPETVPLVYALVVKPAPARRQNVTGIYLSTPASEYYGFITRYFPKIQKVGIVHDPESAFFLSPPTQSALVYKARNPYEFVKGVKVLEDKIDAFLLLPEKNLLSSAALEELFRESYSKKIPVIGVSEKHVKMGSLFALVFDNSSMADQIVELVRKVMSRGSAEGIPATSPERVHLFLNTKTAKDFNIQIPRDLLKQARKVYQ